MYKCKDYFYMREASQAKRLFNLIHFQPYYYKVIILLFTLIYDTCNCSIVIICISILSVQMNLPSSWY